MNSSELNEKQGPRPDRRDEHTRRRILRLIGWRDRVLIGLAAAFALLIQLRAPV